MSKKSAFILALFGSAMLVLAGILGLIENQSIKPFYLCLIEISVVFLLIDNAKKYKNLIWLFLIYVIGCSAIIIANLHKMYASYMSYDELPVTSHTMLLLFTLLMINSSFDNYSKRTSEQPGQGK